METSIHYLLSGTAPAFVDHVYLLEESFMPDADAEQIVTDISE